jgi:cysteine-rich repeat protein
MPARGGSPAVGLGRCFASAPLLVVLLAWGCAGRSTAGKEGEGSGGTSGGGLAKVGGSSNATSTGGTGESMRGGAGNTTSAGGAGMGAVAGNSAGGSSQGRLPPPRPRAGCGDLVADAFEECDDGNKTGGDGCNADCSIERDADCPLVGMCTLPVCGDGRVARTREACDDGNVKDGDGCSADCSLESGWICPAPGLPCRPLCGDGRLVGSEQCEPGSGSVGDCSETCHVECADMTAGTAGAGNEGGAHAGTSPGCRPPVCGDGVVSGSEECDDGTASNDGHYGGCLSNCHFAAYCGDGVKDFAEECDDADFTTPLYTAEPRIACTAACLAAAYCGDGAIDANYGETCDEGARTGVDLWCEKGCLSVVP